MGIAVFMLVPIMLLAAAAALGVLSVAYMRGHLLAIMGASGPDALKIAMALAGAVVGVSALLYGTTGSEMFPFATLVDYLWQCGLAAFVVGGVFGLSIKGPLMKIVAISVRVRHALCASTIVLVSTSALAAGIDTESIRKGCTLSYRIQNGEISRPTSDQMSEALECLHYVSGFWHGYVMGSNDGAASKGICMPSGVMNDQKVTVLVRWLEKNPNKWHLKVWDAVYMAFKDAFPCSK